MRHYVRLSQKNYGIDTGLFPLGSCTMKHNARLNEKMARLPGFRDVHPLQPVSTVQGALELMNELGALSHDAHRHDGRGAVAEGRRPWRAVRHDGDQGRHRRQGRGRDAQGGAGARIRRTAPIRRPPRSSASQVKPVPARDDGWVHVDDVKALLGPDVAAIMLTNPNTCGLFEPQIVEIAEALHEAGAYFYCDGANFNAIVGKARPGDLGVDAMHINLHKTFSTPAWRRRAGLGPGRALGAPGALRARAVRAANGRGASSSSSTRMRPAESAPVRTHHRLPRPDGHVSCARSPTCSRTAPTA